MELRLLELRLLELRLLELRLLELRLLELRFLEAYASRLCAAYSGTRKNSRVKQELAYSKQKGDLRLSLSAGYSAAAALFLTAHAT
nr:hypothetical protein [uncultured Acetatifactor sp.]